MSTLYYGDNLQVLRDRIPSDSIDLIYHFAKRLVKAKKKGETYDPTPSWRGPT